MTRYCFAHPNKVSGNRKLWYFSAMADGAPRTDGILPPPFAELINYMFRFCAFPFSESAKVPSVQVPADPICIVE